MSKSKYFQYTLIFSQRVELQELLSSGISKTQIANLLGVAKTTIYREMKRCPGIYNAEEAQLHADEVKAKKDQNNAKYRNEIRFRLDLMEDKLQRLEHLLKGNNA